MEISRNDLKCNLKIQAIIKIRLYKSTFTICCICDNHFVIPDKRTYKFLNVKNGEVRDIEIIKGEKKFKLTTSALFLQPFVRECVNSNIYRLNVVSYLREISGNIKSTVFLKLILEPPDKEIIDYAW